MQKKKRGLSVCNVLPFVLKLNFYFLYNILSMISKMKSFSLHIIRARDGSIIAMDNLHVTGNIIDHVHKAIQQVVKVEK